MDDKITVYRLSLFARIFNLLFCIILTLALVFIEEYTDNIVERCSIVIGVLLYDTICYLFCFKTYVQLNFKKGKLIMREPFGTIKSKREIAIDDLIEFKIIDDKYNLKDNDFYVEIVAKNGFTRRFTWCQYRFYLFHKSAYNDLRVKLRVWCGECNLALSRYREIELAELEKALEEL